MYDATRGVDVGTKTEIYQLMREQCEKGVGDPLLLDRRRRAVEHRRPRDRPPRRDGARHLDGADLTERRIIAASVGGLRESVVSETPSETLRSGRAARLAPPPPAARAEARALCPGTEGDLPLLMPYVYVIGLGLAIYLLEPSLIDGAGAIDARFTLVVPLALVAFGQTLVMFTRGIDLSIGGMISLVSALIATQLNAGGPARSSSCSPSSCSPSSSVRERASSSRTAACSRSSSRWRPGRSGAASPSRSSPSRAGRRSRR